MLQREDTVVRHAEMVPADATLRAEGELLRAEKRIMAMQVDQLKTDVVHAMEPNVVQAWDMETVSWQTESSHWINTRGRDL
jgi:hypothetical protein